MSATPHESPRAVLQGRRALVTGASQGVGRACALELARRGAHVLVVGRDAARLAPVVDACGGPERATAVVQDLAREDWSALDAALAAAPVEVLVHAAASFAPYGPLEERADDELDPVVRVHLTAALRLARRVLAGMKACGYGRVVLVGSRAASLGAGGQAAYAAAKAGLEGLARSLALEGGRRGVTANVVELGLVDTPGVRERVREAYRGALAERSAVGRAGTAEEAAAAVAFLTGPDAGFVTGSVLRADGGLGLGLPRPTEGEGC